MAEHPKGLTIVGPKSEWDDVSSLLFQEMHGCCHTAEAEEVLRSARLVCESWCAAASPFKRHWKARHACKVAQLVAIFPHLTHIDLTDAGPHNLDELKLILCLSGLQSLVMISTPIRVPSRASHALEQAAGLQTLKIRLRGATPNFSFAKLTKLTKLHLHGRSNTLKNEDTAESGLAQAASLLQLQELRLPDMALTSVACASLCKLSQLRCVSFKTLINSSKDLDCVALSPPCQTLCHLKGPPEQVNIGNLVAWQLHEEEYQLLPLHCQIPVKSTSRLTRLTKLFMLGPRVYPFVLAMPQQTLGELQELRDLTLVNCCFASIDDAQTLADLKGLKALKLQHSAYGGSMTSNFVPVVTALTGLTALRHFNPWLGPALLDSDVGPLTALTNLRLLCITADVSLSTKVRLHQRLPLLRELYITQGEIENSHLRFEFIDGSHW